MIDNKTIISQDENETITANGNKLGNGKNIGICQIYCSKCKKQLSWGEIDTATNNITIEPYHHEC